MTRRKIEFAERLPTSTIERETQRVVDEHLPTVFATQKFFSETLGQPYPPEKVIVHIRKYFSLVDRCIDEAAEPLNSPPEIKNDFKLLFRQLYTVASIESHLAAIERGREEVLKITKGKPENIRFRPFDSQSGKLFRTSVGLLSQPIRVDSWESYHPDVEAVLIADDVTHSGVQLWSTIMVARAQFPQAKIVASVGVATSRALDYLQEFLNPKVGARVIYQRKALCLSELIKQCPLEKREPLRKLARNYFRLQLEDVAGCLRATHIITPFKMPDSVSNGPLSSVVYQGKRLPFAMEYIDSQRDRQYPAAL